jgi:hypothetical protein
VLGLFFDSISKAVGAIKSEEMVDNCLERRGTYSNRIENLEIGATDTPEIIPQKQDTVHRCS